MHPTHSPANHDYSYYAHQTSKDHSHYRGMQSRRPEDRPAVADDTNITVIQLDTGELLSTHHIELTETYWRNTQRASGRWPEAP